MEAGRIVNAFNRILDLGDTLDNSGGGVKQLTNGLLSTREALKIDLCQFLLYIANSCDTFTDRQAAVIRLVLGKGYLDVSTIDIQKAVISMVSLYQHSELVFLAFHQSNTDNLQQNGENLSVYTNIILRIYEAFGKLMAEASENTAAQSRFEKLINEMKAEANSKGLVKNSLIYSEKVAQKNMDRTDEGLIVDTGRHKLSQKTKFKIEENGKQQIKKSSLKKRYITVIFSVVCALLLGCSFMFYTKANNIRNDPDISSAAVSYQMQIVLYNQSVNFYNELIGLANAARGFGINADKDVSEGLSKALSDMNSAKSKIDQLEKILEPASKEIESNNHKALVFLIIAGIVFVNLIIFRIVTSIIGKSKTQT